jgi:hypothetical protein
MSDILAQIEIPNDCQVNTDEELEAVLAGISFKNSVLDFKWRYRYKPFYDMVPSGAGGFFPVQAGWLLWVEFERPDVITGLSGVGRGRDEIVRKGCYESGLVKTAYVLYRFIIEHEAMEGFRYNDIRVFNPHNTVHELSLPARIAAAKQIDVDAQKAVRNLV